jgi:mycoredoxin
MSDPETSTVPGAGITVYWRPGCGFCSALFRQLDQLHVAYDEVDIWSHPDGAAFVRSVARGNETVPTVAVGPVAMVNPSVHDVLEAAGTHAPASVPDGYVAPRRNRFGR